MGAGEHKHKVRKNINVKAAYIHHIHAWNLTDQEIHFEAHVELSEDLTLSAVKPVQQKINRMLKSRFRIHHNTLQFEYNSKHSKKAVSEN